MTLGRAYRIFKEDLWSDKVKDAEKIEASQGVARMETHNSIKKAALVDALQWIFSNYDFLELGESGHTPTMVPQWPTEHCWVPTDERLPKEAGVYLVMYKFGQFRDVRLVMYAPDIKDWITIREEDRIPVWDPPYWMPLPEPPEEDEHE